MAEIGNIDSRDALYIYPEGILPSKNLFKSILGEIIFTIVFIGIFGVLLCLFKTKLPKIKFDIIKVTVNKTVINFAFDKMWIHGLLHLLGYDHVRQKDYKQMLSKEQDILKRVN